MVSHPNSVRIALQVAFLTRYFILICTFVDVVLLAKLEFQFGMGFTNDEKEWCKNEQNQSKHTVANWTIMKLIWVFAKQ